MPVYLSHVLTRLTILQIPRILQVPWFLPHVQVDTLTRLRIWDKGFHSPFVHANIPYPCAACAHHYASSWHVVSTQRSPVTSHRVIRGPLPNYYITLGLTLGSDRAVLLQVSHSERQTP